MHRGNHHYGEGRQRLRMPPPIVSQGPRERRCPLVRESCWLSPCRKIRMAGTSVLARSLSWPARLSGGAAPLERTPRANDLALTRGARSGAATCPGRLGSWTCWLSGEGYSPRRLAGCSVLGPFSLLGLALYKSGPLGVLGLLLRQVVFNIQNINLWEKI